MECWYCSDENVSGHFDRQFQARVAWDVPMLEGYPHRFFRNRSWKPSLYNGFFGLINPGLISALWKNRKCTVVVHGWNYFTHVMAVVVARLAGHTVCIRGESPLNQELLKPRFNRLLKVFLLKNLLFRFVHYFLFIGKQNRDFYEYYDVPSHKLLFTPYAVDNERFQKAAATLDKVKVREELGIDENAFVILFTAKFIEKKRPMDLLRAYAEVPLSNKCLIMVGDGELHGTMKKYLSENGLTNVFFPGFVNQTGIVKYYAAADIFVLCSGEGETWGLSVNEAMNFNLPVVVSRMCGCADDLVVQDTSGFTYETGSVSELVDCIIRTNMVRARLNSKKIIEQYSFQQIQNSLMGTVSGRSDGSAT
jgi:glycosyltransferase involved in cell wall biosynthesis